MENEKVVIHKIVEAETITKRTLVCGIPYVVKDRVKSSIDNVANPGVESSLYWIDVNCIDCLITGTLRKYLGYYTK